MSRHLIVNADDLGMSEAVDRGILEAHARGIVTSATAITTAPTSERGIARALRVAPRLGLGLHVDLSYGRPVLPPRQVPSLVREDGTFVSVTRGLAVPQHWDRHEVRAEVHAQFDRFVALAGRLPDHLDSHQLVGTFSTACRDAMMDLALTHDLPVRAGGRSTLGGLERSLAHRGAWQMMLSPVLSRRLRASRHVREADGRPRSPDVLELSFYGRRATTRRLLRILGALPEGVTELVCHPGYRGDERDAYAYREAELGVLTDSRVAARIVEGDIALTTYAVLKRPTRSASTSSR